MGFFWPLWAFFDWLRQRQYQSRLLPEHALGKKGEDLAHRHLQRLGFVVIERGWRSARGLREVDLIAWHEDRLVFVEVKSRRREDFGSPDRNIDRIKIIALRSAAYEYCRKARIPPEKVRFDLVSIVMQPQLKIQHELDAISLRSG